MAKKAAKKSSSKKAKTTQKSAQKAGKKSAKKSGAKRAPRKTYSDSLKKKVVSAIKKGMTHLEASKAFEVGVHSIPNWIKRHI
jgi:hypothetical protein